jgi:hypothetical protein
MNESALRLVKIAAVVMGVLIVIGTTTLFVMLAKRGMAPGADRSALPAAGVAAILDEPPGTRIAGVAPVQEWLAIQLSGGGADRVVLLDARSGQVVGRVALAR